VTPKDLAEALGEAVGEAAKEAALMSIREAVQEKCVRNSQIAVEVCRVRAVVMTASAEIKRGACEAALDRLLDEHALWEKSDDEWVDSERVMDLREKVMGLIHALANAGEGDKGDDSDD
jgi:hypothetical protein